MMTNMAGTLNAVNKNLDKCHSLLREIKHPYLAMFGMLPPLKLKDRTICVDQFAERVPTMEGDLIVRTKNNCVLSTHTIRYGRLIVPMSKTEESDNDPSNGPVLLLFSNDKDPRCVESFHNFLLLKC